MYPGAPVVQPQTAAAQTGYASYAPTMQQHTGRSKRVWAAYECEPGSHKSSPDDYPTATTSRAVATTSAPAIPSTYTWSNATNAATNAC